MQGYAGWLRGFAAILVLMLSTSAAAQVPGKEFVAINPPQPAAGGGRIEVIEFFSYACPHCQALQPSLAAWLKRKPADVEFKRVPAVFNESWIPFAQIYYTLEAMGLVEKLHHDVFTAYHAQKLKLQDPKVLADWVASKGVDRQKFMETYNSFSVKSLAKRAADTPARYRVEFTPAIVVDGRYLTGPSMTASGNTIDYDRFFKVVDSLTAAARKKPAGK